MKKFRIGFNEGGERKTLINPFSSILILVICSFLLGLGISYLVNGKSQETYLVNDQTVENVEDHYVPTTNDEIDPRDHKEYYEGELINYIAYRIHYVREYMHTNGQDTNPISWETAEAWATEIVRQSYVLGNEEFVQEIDPLLLTAIIETETNFVVSDHYDEGRSIGIASMKRDTAKIIADQLGEKYSFWSVMEPTDRGIKYAAYYLGQGLKRFNSVYEAVAGYNLGHGGVDDLEDPQSFEYVGRVMDRYKTYKNSLEEIEDFENIEIQYSLIHH